jgi:peptidoglycan/xylan/chitin deacetylase (PgdA/CDA1 family)
MRSAGRVLILALSLVAGSWVGLGRPSAETARAWGDTARDRLLNHAPAAEPAPTLPTETPVAVDPTQLPDPTPFPRLNPDETTHRAWLLAEGPSHAESDGRRLVTFTFDDGPFPETTPDILALLAKHHVRAAFFWIGRYLDGDGDREVTDRAVARQVVAAGHFIGNHTHDHEKLTALTRREALEQIDEGAASIRRITGSTPTLFRPPYGALDPWMSEALRKRGMELVLWSIEAQDMTHADPVAMADSLRAQIEYAGGGVVLLHDIRLTTIPVLAKLLDWLDAHKWDPTHPERLGYSVVDLAEYMQQTARSPQPYPDRPSLERARAHQHGDRERARLVRASDDGESEATVLPL